jgi:hypothetical protein
VETGQFREPLLRVPATLPYRSHPQSKSGYSIHLREIVGLLGRLRLQTISSDMMRGTSLLGDNAPNRGLFWEKTPFRLYLGEL